MPNVVATATNADGPIYEGAFGPKAVGKPDPVTVDTLYRIASMTKMVTTVAALQLAESGVIDLDDAVAKYRPEFADLKVLDGWDGDEPRLRDPKTFATVRQLATHTSGLGYWFWNADLVRWEAKTGTGQHARRHRGRVHRAAGRRPGHEGGVRHQHRLARPGGRGGVGPEAGRLLRRAHPRPARHGADLLPPHRPAAREPVRGAPPRRASGQLGGHRAWTGTPRPTGGPAATACTARRASTCASSGCCSTTARSTARRSSRPRRSRTRSPTRSATSTGPRRSPPPSRPRPPTSTPARATSSASACCATPRTSRACGAPAAAPGRASSTPTSGWTATAGVSGAIYTQTLPFVEPAVFQVYIDFEKALYASL